MQKHYTSFNLCVVSPGYPTKSTIDFIFVDQLCQAIADRGVSVSIIAPQSISKVLIRRDSYTKEFTEIVTAQGNTIHLYRPFYVSFGAIGGRLNRMAFSKAVKKAFLNMDRKPDICYGHFWESVFSLLPLAKRKSIPLYASSGEDKIDIHLMLDHREIEEMKSYVSSVVSVSTKNKSECIQAGLADEPNIFVLPNSVDLHHFKPLDKIQLRSRFGIEDRNFVVSFVGQFNERKGIDRLVKALQMINDESILSIFLGSGSVDPSYERVIIADTVPHALVPSYLNCADVFILPTLNEGCSNAIIEAMACGLPIISSDLPFNDDILSESNSIRIDPTNIEQISNAIVELKNNREKRLGLARGALDTAKRLDITNRADSVIKILLSKPDDK